MDRGRAPNGIGHLMILGTPEYGNGRSEQSGQLLQLGRAPDMSGKVRTM